jgi:Domain of unknown function (DUF4157)
MSYPESGPQLNEAPTGTLRRLSSEFEPPSQAPTAENNPVHDALSRTTTNHAQGVGLLTHIDDPARSRVVNDLQQTQGNAYVQRMVQRMIQRSAPASTDAPEADEDLATRIQAKSGAGDRLETGVQRKLESGLGADLSAVRIHTDDEADHLARSVGAVAFTSGSDIFFRQGASNLGSTDGMETLAHEAVHTIQQAAGPVDGTPTQGGVSVSNPSDPFEHAASAAAREFVADDTGSIAATTNAAPNVLRAPPAGVSVQRDGPEPPGGDGGGPSLAGKHTFSTPKIPVEINQSVSPIPAKLASIAGSAEITFEVEGNEPEPKPDGSPTIKAGAAGIDGVQLEVETKWKDSFIASATGMTPKLSTGGKVTKEGGEVGIEAAIEGENVNWKLGFVLLEVEKGEIKFPTLKPGAEVKLPKQEMELSGGLKATAEILAKVEANIEPDWATIADDIADFLGPDAVAAMVPIAGAAAAGAACVAFLAGTMYLADQAGKKGVEAGQAAVAAGEKAQSYSESFTNVATGGTPTGGSQGAKGAEDAETQIESQVGLRKAIIEKNKQKEAYTVIAQKIYNDNKIQFREKHKDETIAEIGAFLGVQDLGTGLHSYLQIIAIVLENRQPGGPPLEIDLSES